MTESVAEVSPGIRHCHCSCFQQSSWKTRMSGSPHSMTYLRHHLQSSHCTSPRIPIPSGTFQELRSGKLFSFVVSTTHISNNTGRLMVLLCSFNAKTGILRFLNCKPQVPSFPTPVHLSRFFCFPTSSSSESRTPLFHRVTTPILRLPVP